MHSTAIRFLMKRAILLLAIYACAPAGTAAEPSAAAVRSSLDPALLSWMDEPVRSRLEALRDETVVTSEMQEAGAVVLLNDFRSFTTESGHGQFSIYCAILILDEEAADDYQTWVHVTNTFYKEDKLDFARVLYPDGDIKEVRSDAIQLKAVAGAAEYSDKRYLTFSTPTLEVGSVIEVCYSGRSLKLAIPGQGMTEVFFHHVHFDQKTFEVRMDPVRRARFVQILPETAEFMVLPEDCRIEPQVSEQAGWRKLVWETTDLPGQVSEWGSPHFYDMLPSVNITSGFDWELIDAWAAELFLPAVEPTPEVAVFAGEAVGQAQSRAEKIEALFYHVEENIRYVNADWNRGGVTPHAAAEVLDVGYGDCKDQVVLLVSMLESLGIEAWPALVNDRSLEELNPEVPSLRDFSHCICFVPSEEGDIWLDPAPDQTQYPGMNWGSLGRWAFVIDGRGGRLVRTPTVIGEVDEIRLDINLAFEEEIPAGVMELTADGSMAAWYKTMQENASDSRAAVFQILQSYFPRVTLAETEFPGLRDPRAPFRAIAEFDFDDPIDIDNPNFHIGGTSHPLFQLLPTLQYGMSADTRQTDLELGMPVRVISEVTCPPPGVGFVGAVADTSITIETPGYRIDLRLECDLRWCTARITLEKSDIVIAPEDFADFRAGVKMISELWWRLTYIRPDDH